TSEENVVDNDDGAIFERERKLRCVDHRQLGAGADIIAMHRDIDRSGFDVDLSDFANEIGKPPRDLYPTQRDSREHDRFQIGVLLDDFVGDAAQRTSNRFSVQDLSWTGT